MKDYWVDDRGQIHRRGQNQTTPSHSQTDSYTPGPLQQNNNSNYVDNTTFWVITAIVSPIIYGLLGYFLAYPILDSLDIMDLPPFVCGLICASIALITAIIYNSKQYGVFESKHYISLIFPLGIIVGLVLVISVLIFIIGFIVILIALGLFLGGWWFTFVIMSKLNNLKGKTVYIISLGLLVLIVLLIFKYQEFLLDHLNYGYVSIFLSCLIANATVLFPAPSTGIVLSFSLIYPPLIVSLLGGTGAALGEMIGYVMGYTGRKIFDFSPTNMRLLQFMKKNDILTIAVFSFLPLPIFDIIGISAGILQINPLRFFLPCLFGKLLKMSLYAFLGNELIKIINNIPGFLDILNI